MKPAGGATPAGVQGEEQTARWVKEMFAGVAPRYDLLNHLLSFNVDRYWRAHTVRRVEPILTRPEACVLDLCCGTGDLLLALETRRGAQVWGSDFCHPMLTGAQRKIGERGFRSTLFEADGLQLPLADGSLDLVTIAFGFRNFANYEKGLDELFRVLRPGGVLAVLEFSRPGNSLFRRLYTLYSGLILPAIGGMVSGSGTAYRYLPESVRKFPAAEELAGQMRARGFRQVEFERLTGGIVALHLATA